MKTKSLAFLISIFIFSGFSAAVEVVWLDELDISHVTSGFGTPQINKSLRGNPIRINGKKYERGIGTHAASVLNVRLDGQAKKFSAIVGIDDEVKNNPKSNVIFVVVGDGNELYRSDIMRPKMPAKKVEVRLEGVKELVLAVEAVDRITNDHADWAMARIEYEGRRPVSIEPVKPQPYILTPLPGPQPRITGPKIFGVRPGNPFLFTLTATGQRPMTFSVKGLPRGLVLDPASGRITGTIEKAGKYKTTIIAKNALGQDKREFRITAGDTICLTPPLGWNSWNCWACSVDDEKVRASARAMVESGLINHGWSYINIDDCWMRKPGSNDPAIGEPVRDAEGRIISNAKFPDMKALTDYIHDLGLKAGIYIGPGPTTCQDFEASWKHELLDAQQFAEWGFDYLKYDWCGYKNLVSKPNIEELQKPYRLMRTMLDQVDRDIVYSLCQYGMGQVWTWGEKVGGNCWRTTGDIRDNWASMSSIGLRQAELYKYAGPGHWNDPDMLVVGKVGWSANLHDSNLTPDEQYTHISLWCLLSSPLLIGCPIEQLDPFTLSLLTNDEVLDINQDPLGKQAERVSDENQMQVWVKEMEDGSKAVGLFNLNSYKAQKVTASWEMLGVKGKQRVRDLWRQKDLGMYNDSFTAEVPVHGVVFIRVFPKKNIFSAIF